MLNPEFDRAVDNVGVPDVPWEMKWKGDVW